MEYESPVVFQACIHICALGGLLFGMLFRDIYDALKSMTRVPSRAKGQTAVWHAAQAQVVLLLRFLSWRLSLFFTLHTDNATKLVRQLSHEAKNCSASALALEVRPQITLLILCQQQGKLK